MKITLVGIAIVLQFSYSVCYTDETSICFGKYDGVCVSKADPCPFALGSDEIQPEPGEKICRDDSHRCCKPKRKENKAEKRNSNCGISNGSKFKVFGGWRAMPGEWPWQVEIQREGAHHCGGALIHPNWVVTAAHCTFFFQNVPLDQWRVRVGKTSLNDTEDNEQTLMIAKMIDHPGFTLFTKYNDISLLQLATPAFFDYKFVSPICLPNPDEEFEEIVCTLSGFGKTEHGPDSSNYLLEVNLPVVSLDVCQQKHCHSNTIHVQNLCAGFQEGKRDACGGDSGGPLVCQKVSATGFKQYVLAGVVSYGSGCGDKDTPGIYTRITSYLDWIEYETGLPVSTGEYSIASSFTPRKIEDVKTANCTSD